MSEQRLLEFRSRAEELVALPDLGQLERRGEVRRRRRQAFVATLAAAGVAVVAWLSTTVGSPRADQSPVDNERLASATEYLGRWARPTLEPGTYSMQVSPLLDRPTVLVDLSTGWHAWNWGPNRGAGMANRPHLPYAGLIVTDLYDVVDKPCQPGSDGMKTLGNDPQELVDALVALPRATVLAGPEADDRFGYPATHLRIHGGDQRCPYDEALFLSKDTGLGFPIASNTMGKVADFWVVDVGTRPVAIIASWNPTTPAKMRQTLQSAVSSIELVLPE